jgi:hypothetical protein
VGSCSSVSQTQPDGNPSSGGRFTGTPPPSLAAFHVASRQDVPPPSSNIFPISHAPDLIVLLLRSPTTSLRLSDHGATAMLRPDPFSSPPEPKFTAPLYGPDGEGSHFGTLFRSWLKMAFLLPSLLARPVLRAHTHTCSLCHFLSSCHSHHSVTHGSPHGCFVVQLPSGGSYGGRSSTTSVLGSSCKKSTTERLWKPVRPRFTKTPLSIMSTAWVAINYMYFTIED